MATLAAKGTLPENHPLAAGTFRGVASERALLDQADLLLLVGVDPIEIFNTNWSYIAPVVVLDEVPYTEGPYRPAIEVVARLGGQPAGADRGRDDALRLEPRGHRRLQPAARAALHPTGAGLLPAAVIRIAREQLPDDGILTVDAGQHKVLTCDLWQTRRRTWIPHIQWPRLDGGVDTGGAGREAGRAADAGRLSRRRRWILDARRRPRDGGARRICRSSSSCSTTASST